MTTIGAERPHTKVEVILGVDTPQLPRGGGRGPSGQTPGRVDGANDRKGLRGAPLCWAEGLGPVRCAAQEYVARRTAGEAWQEQARDHPLPRVLRREGGLPCAGLLRCVFLADKALRREQRRRWEWRHLTIGASLR